jgi:GT2 family glycosyltransferase
MLTVSFVIATYNRGNVLLDCLQRTLACGLPREQFSIIVVDNASTDGTAERVGTLCREKTNVRLIRLAKNCGPVAKNAGLHKNPADLVVLLDDDAYPLPGAVARMIDHFEADPTLGAAVFDVMLPDGSREGSAYPDVFIGAGTGLRNSALRQLAAEKQSGGRGGPLLPRDFFMQAEEYDLSFRLIAAGYSVQRFADLPLMHLKSPGARIGQRTTRLDVRNNLYLLAKYLPARLCHELAADWLSRYWRMALARDQRQSPDAAHGRRSSGGRHRGSPRGVPSAKADGWCWRRGRSSTFSSLRRSSTGSPAWPPTVGSAGLPSRTWARTCWPIFRRPNASGWK